MCIRDRLEAARLSFDEFAASLSMRAPTMLGPVTDMPKNGAGAVIPLVGTASFQLGIFGDVDSCDEFAKPAQLLGAHIAPLGLKFYDGKMFPAEYQNNIFIAMHGSWNRETKQGYNVMRVKVDDKGNAKMQPFVEGFLTDEKADPPMWGRPVDVLVLKDGSMLVSDDYNGIIYRVTYGK